MITLQSDEELRKKAEKIAHNKVDFYIHLIIYVMVNILLVVIWWFSGGPDTPPWFVFPLFGWGIGIVAHYFEAFKETKYKDKLTEKEYKKLKEKDMYK